MEINIGKVPPIDESSRSIDAVITDEDGNEIFRQDNFIIPKNWSDNAGVIVADKYARGQLGTKDRETSVFDIINRVAERITSWGVESGYFPKRNNENAKNFFSWIRYIVINQLATFNSPVWFNLGVEGEKQQGSACFLLDCKDDMSHILERISIEGKLFTHGSGCGSNESALRGSMEPLSNGGFASGPVSFMKGYDAFAGVIKSGGKARRAARMVVLDYDHPDVEEFIACKVKQERKAKALKSLGFGKGVLNEMDEVFFQNANHSVRVNDHFMRAAKGHKDIPLVGRVDSSTGNYAVRYIDGGLGKVIKRVDAHEILIQISKATWECGDPGVIFGDKVEEMNIVADTMGKIVSCNPCAEFTFPPNSACNLASINLAKFFDLPKDITEAPSFNRDLFTDIVNIMIIAQDIICENSDYPTDEIANSSLMYRPLGLGLANIGGTLMKIGLPYDSDMGRDVISRVVSYMTALAYEASIHMPMKKPNPAISKERACKVLRHHLNATEKIACIRDVIGLPGRFNLDPLWEKILNNVKKFGLHNAQVTLMAPTGTIALMMDCGDSTGIEPVVMTQIRKHLSGGGKIDIVPQSVMDGIHSVIGKEVTKEAIRFPEKYLTPSEIDRIKDSHVLDTALSNGPLGTTISPDGHLKMMAAVQPFISGAISKTINTSKETTPEQIFDIYMKAWEMGLKSVAIYRDGSKAEQPYKTKKEDTPEEISKQWGGKDRRPLPDERRAITHKFKVADQEGYFTVGMYPDGTPGEIFFVISKDGSTLQGIMNNFGTSISIGLQYGVPLRVYIDKYKYTRFEPHGLTGNKDIPLASSILDYIARWLENKFYSEEKNETVITNSNIIEDGDKVGEICPKCGAASVIRRGRCGECLNCHTNLGCG